jgi:hypothetical protein
MSWAPKATSNDSIFRHSKDDEVGEANMAASVFRWVRFMAMMLSQNDSAARDEAFWG